MNWMQSEHERHLMIYAIVKISTVLCMTVSFLSSESRKASYLSAVPMVRFYTMRSTTKPRRPKCADENIMKGRVERDTTLYFVAAQFQHTHDE
eukprot:scaffold155840_cov39-Prasinocladus_malaysianus.AAC.1